MISCESCLICCKHETVRVVLITLKTSCDSNSSLKLIAINATKFDKCIFAALSFKLMTKLLIKSIFSCFNRSGIIFSSTTTLRH